MEPLDTDYAQSPSARRRAADPARRYNWLLIFPIVGVLVVLLFASAGFFQLNLSPIIDGLMGFLIVLFALFVVVIFWAAAPRRSEQP
jgi:protein-S-isoprenylcysteine O-methyltransferase Ste14